MENLFEQFPEFESIDACWAIYEQDKKDEFWHYLDNFSTREIMAMTEAKYAHEYDEYRMGFSMRHYNTLVFFDKNAAFEQMVKDQEPSNEVRYMMEELERESGYLDNYQYHLLLQ